MPFPVRSTPFPISFPPEMGSDTALVFEEERPSESGLHAVVRAVALAVADPKLHESLFVVIRSAGRVIGGDDILPVAAVVITDAKGGARPVVAALRARARSDAAIIVVLVASAPATEIDAAYEAGAVLCLRAPVDEHQLSAAIGSAIDLHEAKAHADDLMRRLEVQSHLASLGRVTAGFTHEVSNPLTVLATNFDTTRENIEWLLQARDLLGVAIEQYLPPPMKGVGGDCLSHIPSARDVRVALEDMGTAIDRINGVLATARSLAGGGASSRIETVDLASVVGDVRRWAANELQGVEVEELIDEPIVAHADPRLLGQIVLNLVTNAAHAACQLPSPRVRIHVYGSRETAIVSVRDNGPGIPSDVRDRIFEPFFTTRRGQGGTGLGLALCQEFAAQMQAEITLWTAPGRGACFRVHLRRATR